MSPQLMNPDGSPMILKAVDERTGDVVAEGYLDVPFIPEGMGGQITDIRFVTVGQSGSGISPDDAAAILNSGNPPQ